MAKKLGIIENGNLDPYASLNGSKHIIRDASGAKPDENLLEFSNGLDVTDDPTNGKTIVAPNKSLVRQNEIASYILDGDKPSTALSSGKFFVDKNGLLRVANTNISTTDDVTDSNSTVKTVGEVLTELNSKFVRRNFQVPIGSTSTELDMSSTGITQSTYVLVSIIQSNTNLSVGTVKGYYPVSGESSKWMISFESAISTGIWDGYALFMRR